MLVQIAAGEVEDAADPALVLAQVKKWLFNRQIVDPATGTRTIYDDDGVTVLGSGRVYMDAAGTIPYDGTGPIHHTEKMADGIGLEKWFCNKQVLNPATGIRTVYDDDGVNPLAAGHVFMDAGETVLYNGTGPVHSSEKVQ
jgi:hypothetical protein